MTQRHAPRARDLPAPRPTWQAAMIVALLLSALWLLAYLGACTLMALL
ncbi:hypothetical protein [Pseudooceanicola sp.]